MNEKVFILLWNFVAELHQHLYSTSFTSGLLLLCMEDGANFPSDLIFHLVVAKFKTSNAVQIHRTLRDIKCVREGIWG